MLERRFPLFEAMTIVESIRRNIVGVESVDFIVQLVIIVSVV